MMLRGQALNQIYGVGPTKQEVRALAERGQALNRMYHLGSYATARGSSIPERSVEVAVVGTIGAILAGFAATVARRRRRTMIPV